MGSDRDGREHAERDSRSFVRPVTAIIEPLTDLLDESLTGTAELTAAECGTFSRFARQALVRDVQRKLDRVLLLELHAATLDGRLTGGDERERWARFLDLAATTGFRDGLDRRYPTMLARIDTASRQFIAAIGLMAARFVADRQLVSDLIGAPVGALRSMSLDAGDPHRGGHRVARLDFDGGSVMYKPRPVEAEAALDGILAALMPEPDRIRTPRIAVRDGYGWTSYVSHRFCGDDVEVAQFYRNLGRWLAVMRLVGGVDLHAGNIIADGPVPVVIDAETLFTPAPAPMTTGYGAAVDAAMQTRERSVLRVGILPMRVGLLAGVDLSAVGGLPDQQPRLSAPTIAGAGTDGAHFAMRSGRLEPSDNHPCPDPAPERYWDQIGAGFIELSEQLRRLDAAGGLTDLVRPLIGTVVRRVLRSTRVYLDLGRMLWHPASLHDQAAAIERARAVLLRHADLTGDAPDDRAGVDAEIADLLVDDVPVFTEIADEHLVCSTIAEWRSADLVREAGFIDFAAAGAFRDGVPPRPRITTRHDQPARHDRPGGDRDRTHDQLRRDLAAAGIGTLRDSALRGADGTATWLGPVRGEAGWAVRPLPADLYTGQYGVALCLAGYVHEVRAGRADPVEGLDELLEATLATIRATESLSGAMRWRGFTGVAGQIWTWCVLARLRDDPDLLDRARARADLLLIKPAERDRAEVLGGAAGLVVPLLVLAQATGEATWLAVAADVGTLLVETARKDNRGAYWAATDFPDGTGGFGYGSAGCGWALGRLAASGAGDQNRRQVWHDLAGQAFDFDESVRESAPSEWPDPRVCRPELRASWCHGDVGVGLAAADLYAVTGEARYLDLARRSATSAASGLGWSSTLCHGDLGIWELLDTMRRVDPDRSAGAWLGDLTTQVTSALAEHTTGVRVAETTSPSLFTGVSGVILTLLRMHPGSDLCAPSVWYPGPR